MRNLRLLAVITVAAFAAPAVALAADGVHVTGVDLRPLLQEVLLTIGTIVSLIAVWALRKLGDYIKSKTGVNVLAQEQMIREYLDAAMSRGLAYATVQVEKADWADVKFQNEVMNVAAQYVMDSVPGAVEYFKLDRESVVERLVARWPELAASQAPVKTASRARASK